MTDVFTIGFTTLGLTSFRLIENFDWSVFLKHVGLHTHCTPTCIYGKIANRG